MAKKNKYAEIIKWLKGYVPLNQWIYFNVTLAEMDVLSVTSVQSQRVLEEFIDGSRRVEYLFGIALVKEFDNGTSDTNLEAEQEFNNISDWIEEQDLEGNYPEFDDNIMIESVEALETTPSVTVDNQNSVARYQAQYKITYTEEAL